MRTKILLGLVIAALVIPIAVKAVSQDTIDRFIFLLNQPEWNRWGEGVFGDADLLDGLESIYYQAVSDNDSTLQRKVIWAMGETGIVQFAPTVASAMSTEPVSVCYALGKLPSEESVDSLIGILDNDDVQVRDAAVFGLGSMNYSSDLIPARDLAVQALNDRLSIEKESWVLDDIQAAITLIITGVITSETFLEPIEE